MRSLILALAAFPAHADTLDLSGSTITLQETTRAGALAEVIFLNRGMNGPRDEGTYEVSGAGLTISVVFDWDMSATSNDLIEVIPPEGIACAPSCVLILPEHAIGTIYLFDLRGVGM